MELTVDRQQAVSQQRREVAHVPLAPAEVRGVRDGHVVVGLGPDHEHAVAVEDPQREHRPVALVRVHQHRQRALREPARPANAERGVPRREGHRHPALGAEVFAQPANRVERHRFGADQCHLGSLPGAGTGAGCYLVGGHDAASCARPFNARARRVRKFVVRPARRPKPWWWRRRPQGSPAGRPADGGRRRQPRSARLTRSATPTRTRRRSRRSASELKLALVYAPVTAAGYIDPLRYVTRWERTDQGVDAGMPVGAPIIAPSRIKILAIEPDWYAGQPLVYWELLEGRGRGEDPVRGRADHQHRPSRQHPPAGADDRDICPIGDCDRVRVVDGQRDHACDGDQRLRGRSGHAQRAVRCARG